MQHMIVEYSTSSGLHSNASFYTNGAGKKVSHWFGFGLINAEAMVDNAPTWLTVPSSTSCTSTQIDVYSSSESTSITSAYNVMDCFITYLEHVVVTISYKASYRGDVEFYLESPAGTQTKIFSSRLNDSSSSAITWDFMSVHTWGEISHGAWKLTMSDAYGGTSMNLYYWKIQFYGTVTDPLAGTPSAGTLGGSCTNSDDCSGVTDGGCLEDGNICVVCNSGYRVLNEYCKQDGPQGGYCDDAVSCVSDSLECVKNICKTKGTGDEEIDASLIAGAVVGAVLGIILLVVAGYLVYKVCFVAKATATVGPAPPPYPTVFSSQPPPTFSSSVTNAAFEGSHPVSVSIPVPANSTNLEV